MSVQKKELTDHQNQAELYYKIERLRHPPEQSIHQYTLRSMTLDRSLSVLNAEETMKLSYGPTR